MLEYKAYGHGDRFRAADEAIRTAQFIRNKCIRLWMDNRGVGKHDLSAYSAVLPFAGKRNSMARQAAAERAFSAIARFYAESKAKKPGKKSYLRFKKNARSVEYKASGWRLLEDRKQLFAASVLDKPIFIGYARPYTSFEHSSKRSGCGYAG